MCNVVSRVNKIDFFCGAFLSYIISNGVKEPILFESSPSENSKVINFSLRTNDYNAYLKYVSTSKNSVQGGKSYTKWDIVFTEKEKNFIKNSFESFDKENIVILVCANESFRDTYFAVLNIKDAQKCLGNDEVNKQSRISVKRMKGSKYVSCYGTALSDEKAIQIKYNFDEFFGF